MTKSKSLTPSIKLSMHLNNWKLANKNMNSTAAEEEINKLSISSSEEPLPEVTAAAPVAGVVFDPPSACIIKIYVP